jgi:predicted AlkP superfamily pyrophosphatase or phosphodiesterase
MNRLGKLAVAVLLGSTVLSTAVRADSDDNGRSAIKHVLLISVDGMHEIDLQRYVKGHPTSTFAKLLRHGVHYTNAHTSRPSDSFPGLLAFMTGASPRTHGVFYDDTYDHTQRLPGLKFEHGSRVGLCRESVVTRGNMNQIHATT